MHKIAEIGAIISTIYSLKMINMKQLECDPSPIIIILMMIDDDPLNVLNYVLFY